jgi:hypothetical protein
MTVSRAGDAYEQEADLVADQVMRGPIASVQSTCSVCASSESPCSKCETPQPPKIQRTIASSSNTEEAPVPSDFDQNLGPGQQLDAETRSFFESRLGHDFSHVRIHSDEAAERSARDMNAIAYTNGRNIVFGAGRFTPETHEGQRLIAHELTHVVQQGGEANAIQRKPDNDDDDEPVQVGPKTCPSGAVPYNGVCLTDEVLDALVLPEVEGDVKRAEKIVRAKNVEKRAQKRVEQRYEKMSGRDLSNKIDKIREELKNSANPGALSKMLERLEKEQERRRASPISTPTKVDQAVAMLEEAWSLAEKEQPPDMRRAAQLVHLVNSWLQKAAPPSRYGECFSGFSNTTAMVTVGFAKENVDNLDYKLRRGATVGGWWPATINSLKAARELVQIMSGEKRIEDTEFYGISKTINKTSWATPLVGTAIMAAPAIVMSGVELVGLIPALPETIQGVRTAVWGKTLFGSILSASYLSHVYTRSKEASEHGGANPIVVAATAFDDAMGAGKVYESATNQSLLTGEDLKMSKTERIVGGLTGSAEMVMNVFGLKDFLPEPLPTIRPPTKATPPATPKPQQQLPAPSGPAPWTADELAAMKEQGITNLGEYKAAKEAEALKLAQEQEQQTLEIIQQQAEQKAAQMSGSRSSGSGPRAAPPRTRTNQPSSTTSSSGVGRTATRSKGVTAAPKSEPELPEGFEDMLTDSGAHVRKFGSGKKGNEDFFGKEGQETAAGTLAHNQGEALQSPEVLEDMMKRASIKGGIFSEPIPEGAIPEYQVPHPDWPPGYKPRIDRLLTSDGEIIEIKPTHLKVQGEIEAQQYAAWMDKLEPLPGGQKWKWKVITYDQDAFLKYLEAIGYFE